MREATLSGLSTLDAVRPRKAGPSGAKTKPKTGARSVLATVRRLRSRATLVVASAGFTAIMVGIVCNAVLFQKGHHPAPLFGSAPPPRMPVPGPDEAKPAVARLPAPAPASASPPVAPLAAEAPAVGLGTPAASAAPAPHAAAHRLLQRAHEAAKPAKGGDQIARLLAGTTDPARKGEGHIAKAVLPPAATLSQGRPRAAAE